MCEPNTIIAVATVVSVAISAASTAYTVTEQQKQARGNARYQNDVNQWQAAQTEKATILEYDAQTAKLSQEREITGAKNFETDVEAMRRAGEARAVLSSSGLSGLSMTNLINEYDRSKSAAYSRGSQNLRYAGEGVDIANRATALNAENALGSMRQPQYPGMAPYVAAGLSIAGSVAAGTVDYYRYRGRSGGVEGGDLIAPGGYDTTTNLGTNRMIA